MPTISPSDLLRQKRLVIQSSNPHVKESTTGMVNRLAVTLPIRISAVTSSVFIPPTSSQKNFTTGTKSNGVTRSKLR